MKAITAPVEAEFEAFRRLLGEVVVSESAFLKPITRNLLRSGGKQMRPLLTLLTARLHAPQVNERAMAAAVLVEMVHWSTLVHDDVIDEAYVRRGQWTPGALIRSKGAVLLGDYLFSKGLAHASGKQSFASIVSATGAIERIVSGELMQMEYAHTQDTTEAIYTDIIRDKTAALLASAAECGAAESGAGDAQIAAMRRFGELLGLAFQIKDDLLDYGFDGSLSHSNGHSERAVSTGKATGNDLREGKLTLPLIYALRETADPATRREARKHIRRACSAVRSAGKSVGWLHDFVAASGGVEYSVQVMSGYHEGALAILETYPASDVRDALCAYADHVTGRKN